jgi:hypothetical protein
MEWDRPKTRIRVLADGPYQRINTLSRAELPRTAPPDAAMRQVEMPASAEEVMSAVCEAFDVPTDELKKKRNTSDARLLGKSRGHVSIAPAKSRERGK